MLEWKGLLREYKQGRKSLTKLYKAMAKDHPERKVINGMVRDMTFAIEWIEKGRMPGKMKGVDKNDAYEISLAKNYKKTVYAVNGYWDESLEGFASVQSYDNPYLEVEERIDRELEEKRNATT